MTTSGAVRDQKSLNKMIEKSLKKIPAATPVNP
jgi:hypothetical protein